MSAAQKTLYIDTKRCMNCRACETACKLENGAPPGARWTMVTENEIVENGVHKLAFLPVPCMHCGDPACLKACPTGAIYKRPEDGIVLVSKDRCIGCRQCLWACDFGVPQFGGDGKMQKCTLCVHRTAKGLPSACQAACPAEAVLVGSEEEISKIMRTRYARISRRTAAGQPACGGSNCE